MTRPLPRRPPSARPVRVALGTLGVLAVLLATLVGAISAGAQGADSTAEPAVRLVQQTPWVGPDGTFRVAIAADGLPAGARVQGYLFSRLRSRAALDGVYRGDSLGTSIWATQMRPVAELTPAGDRTIVVTVQVSDGPATSNDGVQLSTPGVYPFAVRLYAEGSDRPIAQLTTTLLRLGPPEQLNGDRLSVGVVVPLDATIDPGDDGHPVLDDDAAAQLEATMAAVAGRPDVPLTLTPSPESLAMLDGHDATGAAAVAALQPRVARQVLASPYAPVDSGAWIDANLGGELDEQYTAGNTTLLRLLGTRTDATTAVLDPTVTPAALGHLAGLGVRSVVVPSGQLEPLSNVGEDATFAQQFVIGAGDAGPVAAVAGDDRTAAALAGDDPVLAAHRALAELAELQMSRPGSARGVAVVVPEGTDPTTLSTFLAGLADANGATAGTPGSAVVSPVTLTDLFTGTDVATVTRAGRTTTLERGYRADPPADLGAYPATLRDSRARLAGLVSLVPTAPDLVEPVGTTILSSGSRALDAAGRQAMLAAARGDTDAITSEIVVSPEQVVTLTSSSGRVPLNLENRLQVPATVRIVMSSVKLDFPEGDVIASEELAPAQTTTIELPVETRASGAFPLTVTISSADGTLPVATTTYTVRSTAISGVGLVLSIGAGLFLLVWWARHFRTARRARKLVASTHPALSATGPDGYAPADTEPPATDAGPAGLDTDPLEDR